MLPADYLHGGSINEDYHRASVVIDVADNVVGKKAGVVYV